MENPCHKSGYTPEDLRKYALYRKEEEMKEADNILNSEIEDYTENENYREPLGITKSYELRIELSTGGDADGYKLKFDENKEIASGVYYWADWGVYEEVELSEEEIHKVIDLHLISDQNIFLA